MADIHGRPEKGRAGGTVGVGYVSIMLIFTVICLTIFAVLSFQAVYSSDRMSSRSDGFTQQYYTADSAAKQTLARLDELAVKSSESFSFEDSFIEAASDLDGVTAVRVPEGVRADYSVEMNARQTLTVSVLFYGVTSDVRYDILEWRTAEAEISGESHPSVWNGGDLV